MHILLKSCQKCLSISPTRWHQKYDDSHLLTSLYSTCTGFWKKYFTGSWKASSLVPDSSWEGSSLGHTLSDKNLYHGFFILPSKYGKLSFEWQFLYQRFFFQSWKCSSAHSCSRHVSAYYHPEQHLSEVTGWLSLECMMKSITSIQQQKSESGNVDTHKVLVCLFFIFKNSRNMWQTYS